MPFTNFKIVNATNLWMGFKKLLKYGISIHWDFIHWLAQRDIKEALWKKTRVIKLKIQEKHMTLTSLLMFSSEFNLERELYNTSVLPSHT